MSGNYELYQKIDSVTGGKLTREDPVVMEHGWSSHDMAENPVVALKCINWDERFIRIALWSEAQTATSSIPAVLDIDRKNEVALLSDAMQWGLRPMEYVSIETGFGRQDKALIHHLNQVLGGLEQTIKRQLEREAAEANANELLDKSYSDKSPRKAASLIAKAAQRRAQYPEVEQIYSVDPLQQKALYQRLTKTFGDLRSSSKLIAGDWKETGHQTGQSLILVRRLGSDTHGIFGSYTVDRSSGNAQKLLAAFVVDFSTFHAQATPSLELVKGSTLSLRSPESCQSLKLDSALGALFPRGIKGVEEREKAYRFALGSVGEASKTFYRVPQKAFSPQKRMELFFNVASDVMVQQIYSRDYQVNPEQDRSAVVRLHSQDGRERAVTLIGLRKNERPQDFMKAYLEQEQQQIQPSAKPSLKPKLRRKWR